MADYERSREIRHVIGAEGTVSLRSIAGRIHLRGVGGDEARVVLTYSLRSPDEAAARRIEDAFLARVQRGPGRLGAATGDGRGVVIDAPGPFAAIARAFGIGGDGAMELSAEVPRRATVAVETVSGAIRVEGLEGTQRYRTLSGDMELVAAGSVQADTTSGDVHLDAAAPVALEWHSVSGDLRAEAPGLRDVRLDTMSGDAWLAGRLEAGVEHRARSVSGDLRLALVGGVAVETRTVSGTVRSEVEHRIEGRAGRHTLIVGDGAANLRFESMSGDLLVLRAIGPDAVGPAVSTPDEPALSDADQLVVLRALERGEIDIEEAARRLGVPAHA